MKAAAATTEGAAMIAQGVAGSMAPEVKARRVRTRATNDGWRRLAWARAPSGASEEEVATPV